MATIDSVSTAPQDYRWLLVLGIYVAAALSGFTQALSNNALVYYLTALLLACSATGWCVVDARRRGRPLLPAVQLIALLLWFVAVPIYLLASRGWRGLGWALLNLVGLYVTIFVTYFGTYCLAYGTAAFKS
jgi:hypothetical protein